MTLQFWWTEDDRWLSKHVALKQIINSTRVLTLVNPLYSSATQQDLRLIVGSLALLLFIWPPFPPSFGGRGQCTVVNVIIFCAQHTLS